MRKLTDEHKKDSGNWFGEGVHKVKIGLVEFKTDDKDRDYAEFTLLGENEAEGTARLWFHTDAAAAYSFSIIRSIFIHNTPEGDRDKMRGKLAAINDTDELAKACAVLVGKECWYQVAKSSRTYTAADGTVKNSFDKNIYGYEPKAAPVPAKSGDDKVNLSDGDPQEPLIGDF